MQKFSFTINSCSVQTTIHECLCNPSNFIAYFHKEKAISHGPYSLNHISSVLQGRISFLLHQASLAKIICKERVYAPEKPICMSDIREIPLKTVMSGIGILPINQLLKTSSKNFVYLDMNSNEQLCIDKNLSIMNICFVLCGIVTCTQYVCQTYSKTVGWWLSTAYPVSQSGIRHPTTGYTLIYLRNHTIQVI